ncbi:hypothetical protein PRUPE_2G062300 [Prunus persica]|uniref:Pentatricopeptide repeat-containing protein n=1 Tax=Prunus persica TaxID=3760 RepID=M5XNL0_PRUPE|nr:hypothetical protein PRUPE_2G062300 [Prunus persica]
MLMCGCRCQILEVNFLDFDVYVSYTLVIKALFKLGKLQEDTQITHNILIKCFCKARDFLKAFQLHNEMLVHNLEPTPVTYNVLINGLCVYGDLMDADRLLVSLCDCNINLKVAYTTLIKAHRAKGDVHRAVGLFHQMVMLNTFRRVGDLNSVAEPSEMFKLGFLHE